jgi:uncharacterized membrane protein YdjX (TVP38/TMEM64 family)
MSRLERGVTNKSMGKTGKDILPWVKAAVLIFLLVVLSVLVWREVPSEWLEPGWIEALLKGMGVLAPLAFVLIRTVAIVVTVVPIAPLDIVAGALFSPFWGTVYSLIGSELGAMVCFFLARVLGREAITRLLHRAIPFSDRFDRRQLAYIILFARLEPVFSFALVSYGAGLTRMSPGAFALSTLLGMTPGTIILNYYGKSFFSGNIILQICLGFVFIVLMFLIPLWIRRRNPWGWYDKMTGDGRSKKD